MFFPDLAIRTEGHRGSCKRKNNNESWMGKNRFPTDTADEEKNDDDDDDDDDDDHHHHDFLHQHLH